MTIGLIDVDGGKFPNYALMKIAAYHKALGGLDSAGCTLDALKFAMETEK